MKTLVKLALAALIANAVWRAGSEYASHLRFREGVRLAAAAAGPNDDLLRERIAAEAKRYEIPQDSGAVTIERRERRVGVAGSYRKTIEIVPRYEYPWTFNWEVEVFVVPTLSPASGR